MTTFLDHKEIVETIKDVLTIDIGVAKSAEDRVAEAAARAVGKLLERKVMEAVAEAKGETIEVNTAQATLLERLDYAVKRAYRIFGHKTMKNVPDLQPDGRLLNILLREIKFAIDADKYEFEKAKPVETPAPSIASAFAHTPTDIRIEAYNVAAKVTPNGASNERLHVLASEIERNIYQGFQRGGAPGTADFDKLIDDIFGRNEWRREAWNDARSVMIRSINEQLKERKPSHILKAFRAVELKVIRDFIGSFKFDPSKP